MSNKFERTCIGCNKKGSKKEFIRIIKNENGVFIDKNGKLNGRGAYICNDIVCLNKIIKSRRLEKALKVKIEDSIYQELRGVLIEQ